MKTKRISEATAAICCLLFAACSLASASEFHGANGAFTIDTPAGWKAIDPQLLDAMVDVYGQDSLAAAGAVTRYGFMPALSDTVTNPPYMVVEMRNTVRLPDKLVALQGNEAFLKHSFTEILKSHGVLEKNIIDVRYDSGQHQVYFSFTEIPPLDLPLGLREKNRISKWVTFTEKGSIGVMFVCPNQDWEQWSNVVDRAAASLRIAGNLRYHPHTAELAAQHAMDVRNSFTLTAVILALGIYYVIRKIKSNTVMSDEI